MSILDDLTASVAKQGTVISSATALISGLSAKLQQAISALPAQTDTTQLQALKDEIDAQTSALASAVATGTVATAEAAPPTAATAPAPTTTDTTTAPAPDATATPAPTAPTA